MPPFFTRLLLTAGLLLSIEVAQAQPSATKPLSQALAPQLVLPQRLPLPPGAPAVHYGQAMDEVAARSKVSMAVKPARRPPQNASSKRATRLGTTPSSATLSGPVSEVWAARYNGLGDSYEVATDVVVDAAGNTYVAGYSLSALSYDYALIKYDGASGQQLWQARYNGPNNSLDVASALALDAAGNVYVTGTSSLGNTYTYVTLKYSASGQQLWQATYSGLGLTSSRYNVATDVVVDAASNVYVTGYSSNSAGKYSYGTVKYAGASDQQLWAARYSGATNSDNLTTNLAVDAASNVYMTGTSYAGNQSSYATVKYATGGQQVWVASYNGPGNGYDLVADLAVDAAGNVAVTGASDNGSSYDYATIKYSATGQQLWETRYNGAGDGYDEATSVALDASGNVLVTGYSDEGNSNWDYATIQYAGGSGQPLWEARYNGPDEGYDEATELVVDAANDVLVTGLSYNNDGLSNQATIKYAGGSGQQVWATRYNGPADNNEVSSGVAVDPAGNVYTTGSSVANSNNNWDYATIKYAGASGQQLWQATYNWADNSDDVAVDVAVDAAGNVYVLGSSQSSGSSNVDYVTIKYAATGQELWKARYHSPLNRDGRPVKILVDAAGNVFVTGSNAIETDFDLNYLTLKYDGTTGQQLWEARYGGPSGGLDFAVDMALDGTGNVYVTGRSFGVSSTEYTTIKYDGATGRQLWEVRYNPFDNTYSEASRLVLDAAGNVFVTGILNNKGQIVFATIKYNGTSGQRVWDARFTAVGVGAAVAGLAADAAGNVYITGKSTDFSQHSECVTIKYAANGQQLWVARYSGPAKLYDEGATIAVDKAGDAYVLARSLGNNTGTEMVTIKYAGADGRLLWQTRYGGLIGFGFGADLVLDAAGDVYATGTTGSNFDYFTLKYAAATGQQVWEARYNGPGNGADWAAAVALDATGNVYVTGRSAFDSSSSSGSDFATIKYAQASGGSSVPLVAASRPALAVAATRVSEQELGVYPNPATTQATVSFCPLRSGHAQVLLYNQLGQRVASLYEGAVQEKQRYAFVVQSQQWTPGLYECWLVVNEQRERTRLVIAH